MKTRTIVRNAVAVAAAAGATVAVSAVAASASTSAGTFHGHHSLTPMTGPLSHEAEIATLTHWWRTAPYALTDAGRMPVVVRLPAGSPTPGQWYARDQRFTELHNSAVTELAFAERSHGGLVRRRRHHHAELERRKHAIQIAHGDGPRAAPAALPGIAARGAGRCGATVLAACVFDRAPPRRPAPAALDRAAYPDRLVSPDGTCITGACGYCQ